MKFLYLTVAGLCLTLEHLLLVHGALVGSAQGVKGCLRALARPRILSHWSSVRRSMMAVARISTASLLAFRVPPISVGSPSY
jgi:hypothetical protein